jgi:lactate permease
MPWSQNYLPLGGLAVSALVAALPVIVLLVLLAGWHVRAHLAALAGLATAILVAVFAYDMPVRLAFSAGGFGAAFGGPSVGSCSMRSSLSACRRDRGSRR